MEAAMPKILSISEGRVRADLKRKRAVRRMTTWTETFGPKQPCMTPRISAGSCPSHVICPAVQILPSPGPRTKMVPACYQPFWGLVET